MSGKCEACGRKLRGEATRCPTMECIGWAPPSEGPRLFFDGKPPEPPPPGTWSNLQGDGANERACAETLEMLLRPGGLATFAAGLATARRDKPEA